MPTNVSIPAVGAISDPAKTRIALVQGQQIVSAPATALSDAVGVPSGGTTGQVLTKSSDTDYDSGWADASGGDFTGPSSSIDGNLVAFDGTTGKLGKDSGKKPADFATAAQGALANTAVQPADLATVATSGDYDDLSGAPTIREVLTAARTYYVASTGSDSNDGLTSGTAFATIGKAANVVSALDMSTYQVTISVAAGNYSENVTLRPWIGQLPPLINGASKSTTTFTSVQVMNTLNGCAWRVENIGFANSGSYSIHGAGPGVINFANVDFGGTSRLQHIRAESGFVANASGNFSISTGTSQQMFYAVGAAIVFAGRTVTLAANVSCNAFVMAEILGHIDAWSMTFTLGSFSVTGTRYIATSCSVIHSGGGGASYFPGSTAGSVSTGAQYL